VIDVAEINSETRAEQIAHVLRDEILSGHYREGERLPSERDLAVRFQGSRGAVREAFRKLEQLGIAGIGPGGARVMALENANIDIMGPLLDMSDVPDMDLVGQVLDVYGGLFKIALEQMIARASDEELDEARTLLRPLADSRLPVEERMLVRMTVGRFFMDKSHNLLLRLINNSLQTQFMGRDQSGVLPTGDPQRFVEPVARLDAAIRDRDPDAASRASGDMAAIDREIILAAINQSTEPLATVGAQS
jgi:GntR family transcriptional repressor for pyruvate dehydrogenase complex